MGSKRGEEKDSLSEGLFLIKDESTDWHIGLDAFSNWPDTVFVSWGGCKALCSPRVLWGWEAQGLCPKWWCSVMMDFVRLIYWGNELSIVQNGDSLSTLCPRGLTCMDIKGLSQWEFQQEIRGGRWVRTGYPVPCPSSHWVPLHCLCCVTEGQLLSRKPSPEQSFSHYQLWRASLFFLFPACHRLSQVGTFVNRMQRNY